MTGASKKQCAALYESVIYSDFFFSSQPHACDANGKYIVSPDQSRCAS